MVVNTAKRKLSKQGETKECHVRSILDTRKHCDRAREYLIRWKDSFPDEWLSVTALSATTLLRAFWRQRIAKKQMSADNSFFQQTTEQSASTSSSLPTASIKIMPSSSSFSSTVVFPAPDLPAPIKQEEPSGDSLHLSPTPTVSSRLTLKTEEATKFAEYVLETAAPSVLQDEPPLVLKADHDHSITPTKEEPMYSLLPETPTEKLMRDFLYSLPDTPTKESINSLFPKTPIVKTSFHSAYSLPKVKKRSGDDISPSPLVQQPTQKKAHKSNGKKKAVTTPSTPPPAPAPVTAAATTTTKRKRSCSKRARVIIPPPRPPPELSWHKEDEGILAVKRRIRQGKCFFGSHGTYEFVQYSSENCVRLMSLATSVFADLGYHKVRQRAASVVGRILAGYGNAPPSERSFTATLIVSWRGLDVSACTFSYHPGNKRRFNSARIFLRLLATEHTFRLLGLGSLCISIVQTIFSEMPCDIVIVASPPDALGFYFKLGFRDGLEEHQRFGTKMADYANTSLLVALIPHFTSAQSQLEAVLASVVDKEKKLEVAYSNSKFLLSEPTKPPHTPTNTTHSTTRTSTTCPHANSI